MGDVYSLPMSQPKDADVLIERCRRFGRRMPAFYVKDADVLIERCRCPGQKMPMFHAWDADVPGVRRRRFSVCFINV